MNTPWPEARPVLDKGLRRFYETGSTAGINPDHTNKLQLAALDTAATIEDMDIPGFRLHPLKGTVKDNGQLRLAATGD